MTVQTRPHGVVTRAIHWAPRCWCRRPGLSRRTSTAAAAAARSTDADVRRLLGDFEAAEALHERGAAALIANRLGRGAGGEEDAVARWPFVLTWVQPGLAGLMDGSVST